MQHVQIFAAFVISVAATLIAVPPVRQFAISRNWVDKPDGGRKLHRRPIVCVGGITILVGLIAGCVYLIAVSNLLPYELAWPPPFVVAGAAVVFTMGLVDDVRGLTFRTKFVIQIAAAYLLIMGGLRLDLATALIPGINADLAFYLTLPVTMLWIVGIVNAVNLVDGLDGLAAGLTLIAMTSFALVYGVAGEMSLVLLALPIIGALTGFLTRNFNPASIFMGNSGSYLLGYLLAVFSIQTPTHSNPIVSVMIVLVILGLPVLDTAYSFLRRFLNGSSPFTADCDHVHHRLVRRYSHRAAVMIMYAVGALLGTAGVAMAGSESNVAVTVFAAVIFSGLVGLRLLGYVPLAFRRLVVPEKSTSMDGSQEAPRTTSNGRASQPRPRFGARIRSLKSSSQT
jgi:UDP-GlcNAc:undecaprenyl-phosphate GlcNAc-1-phosphate transferase